MFQLPRGNWDSHCHVFSPDKYPFARDTPYTPPAHAVDELLANSPCDNHVIVMSLAEGTDCSSMLDAIQTHRAIRGDARGVAVLSDDQLKDVATCRYYYQAGVRSVRIHEARIRSMLGKKDLELDDLVAVFIDTARAIHDIKVDWSIEAQLDLTIWAGLIPTLRSLKDEYSTTFVVDHTFNMTPRHLTSPDFKKVLQGLKEGFIWVKLSGMSRFSPDFMALESILRTIVTTRPDRVIFGSDAPHVLTEGKAERFANVDVNEHLKMLKEICSADPGWWDLLMRDNAQALYQ